MSGSGYGANEGFQLAMVPCAVGILLAALALRPGPEITPLARLGRLTLGVYCAHLLFIWGFARLFQPTELGALLLTVPVIVCATALAWLLAQFPQTRPLVV